METVRDFEDILALFAKHEVTYLIIGGLAFVFHAMPRFTKDIDLWIEAAGDNERRANEALAEFGSPELLEVGRRGEILQLGVAPNRIDLLRDIEGVAFSEAFARRIVAPYGDVKANWIELDDLISIKRLIDHPRHREDVRILELVRQRRERKD